jgi:hypothetical protein
LWEECRAPYRSKMMRFRICFLAFLLALLSVIETLVEDSTIAQPYDAGNAACSRQKFSRLAIFL